MIRASIAVLSVLAATAATAADDPNNKELAWWRLVNQVMDDPMSVHFESCILETGCYISANDRKTIQLSSSAAPVYFRYPIELGYYCGRRERKSPIDWANHLIKMYKLTKQDA